MSAKTIATLGVVFAALLTLAVGGWIVKGAKALTGQRRRPTFRPRFA